MIYLGQYDCFNPEQINTYPANEGTNKVKAGDLINPDTLSTLDFDIEKDSEERITMLANEIIEGNQKQTIPVLFKKLIKLSKHDTK